MNEELIKELRPEYEIIKGRYVYATIKTAKDFNKLIYQNFTASEMNFFSLLLSRASEQDERENNKVRIDIKELINYDLFEPEYVRKHLYGKLYKEWIREFFKKQLKIRIWDKEENNFYGVLFSSYVITEDERTGNETSVIFELSQLGYSLTKQLGKNYFKYYFQEYLMMKSKYSKRLYIELRQYEKVGQRIMTKDELIEKLDAEKYWAGGNFETKILKPASEELKAIYPNLTYKKIKKGRNITGYVFDFKANKFFGREKEYDKELKDKYLKTKKSREKVEMKIKSGEELKVELEEFKRTDKFFDINMGMQQNRFTEAKETLQEAYNERLISYQLGSKLSSGIEKRVEKYNITGTGEEE